MKRGFRLFQRYRWKDWGRTFTDKISTIFAHATIRLGTLLFKPTPNGESGGELAHSDLIAFDVVEEELTGLVVEIVEAKHRRTVDGRTFHDPMTFKFVRSDDRSTVRTLVCNDTHC
jgi:hypothetical protein